MALPCANPDCEYPANDDPDIASECPGFCCEKCMGRFNGEEWAMVCTKKHTKWCSKRLLNDEDDSSTGARHARSQPQGRKGSSKSIGSSKGNGKGEQAFGMDGACKGKMGWKGGPPLWPEPAWHAPFGFKGEMGWKGGLPAEYMAAMAAAEAWQASMAGAWQGQKASSVAAAAAAAWQAPARKGGGGGARAKCAHPECEYMRHSDPSVSKRYCCEKCEGLHQGADWAEGGKRHYKSCEKMEIGSQSQGSSGDSGNRGYGGAWGGKGYGNDWSGKGHCGKGAQEAVPGVKREVFRSKQLKTQAQTYTEPADPYDEEGKYPDEHKVWVRKLPKGTSTEELKNHFEQIGTVVFARASKGTTATVVYESEDEALSAILGLNETEFAGQTILVELYNDKGE